MLKVQSQKAFKNAHGQKTKQKKNTTFVAYGVMHTAAQRFIMQL